MNKNNLKELYLTTLIGIIGSLITFIISRLALFSPQGNKTLEGLAFGLGAIGIGGLIILIIVNLNPSAKKFLVKNQKIKENDERLQLINYKAQAKAFSITLYALCISVILSCIITLDIFIVLSILLISSVLIYIFFLNYYDSKI